MMNMKEGQDQGAAVWRVVHKVCDDSGEVWSRSDGRGLGFGDRQDSLWMRTPGEQVEQKPGEVEVCSGENGDESQKQSFVCE